MSANWFLCKDVFLGICFNIKKVIICVRLDIFHPSKTLQSWFGLFLMTPTAEDITLYSFHQIEIILIFTIDYKFICNFILLTLSCVTKLHLAQAPVTAHNPSVCSKVCYIIFRVAPRKLFVWPPSLLITSMENGWLIKPYCPSNCTKFSTMLWNHRQMCGWIFW